jgi:hypothetical protein
MGKAKKAKRAIPIGRAANTQVVMNGAEVPVEQRRLVATCDLADRAHDVRDPDTGLLRPTRRLPKGMGKQRMYHECNMVLLAIERIVRGRMERRIKGSVSFETQFEKQAEREAWLEENELAPAPPNLGAQVRVAMAMKQARMKGK